MDKKQELYKKIEKMLWYFLLLILLLWSLPLADKGIDLRDTGSYLTKYRYIFNSDIKVNELHYFLGEVMGGILYACTPVCKVLVLNLASCVLYILSALLLYRTLRTYLPKIPLMLCVLTGTFYGITWIRTLNWNAWTSLWLTVGLLLLMKGLETGRQRYLCASGFVLGINTYFRFPNMLFLSLIVVIFWKEVLVILEENGGEIRTLFSWKQVLRCIKQCLGFFLGAVLAAAAGLVLALLILGPDTVIGNLTMLTHVGAGANDENTHSITTGIYLFLIGMRDGAYTWIKYGVLLAFGAAAAGKVGKHVSGKNAGRIRAAAVVLAGFLGLYPGMCADILSAHEWTAFGAVFFGIAGAFYYGKKDRMLSCLCAAAAAIEGFLTIGTDTGVNYYRVYMGLPLALILILCVRGIRETKEKQILQTLYEMIAVFSLVFVTAAGIRYAATHVYHDAPNEALTCTIDHPDYTGIKTSRERAESLNRLMEVLEPYEDQKLLQIGCFNVGVVLTDMEPFFESSWPDLEYLPMETFEQELERALEEDDLPVLLLGTAEESGISWSPKKYEKIQALGESDRYETLYVDPLYTIYVPSGA